MRTKPILFGKGCANGVTANVKTAPCRIKHRSLTTNTVQLITTFGESDRSCPANSGNTVVMVIG